MSEGIVRWPSMEAREQFITRDNWRRRNERRQRKGRDQERTDHYFGLFAPAQNQHAVLAQVRQRFDAVRQCPVYLVHKLRRFPKGESLSAIADVCARVFNAHEVQEAYAHLLTVDDSFGGIALHNALRLRNLAGEAAFWRISDTAETHGPSGIVALTDLQLMLRNLAEQGRLSVREDMPDLQPYLDEVRRFPMKTGAAFSDWKPLSRACAVGLAVWAAEWWKYATWPESK